jgi:hypothetical protein
MKDFIAKVAKMRQLQKQYFKSRDGLILQACKKVEREVDDFLSIGATASRQQKPDANQPSLF